MKNLLTMFVEWISLGGTNWEDAVGKKVLFSMFGSSELKEGEVLELSPNELAVKIRYGYSTVWFAVDQVKLVEML